LEADIQSLTGLSPTTASKDGYQSAVSNVDSAWDQVKTDAGDLKDVSASTLDSAWDSFTSAVDDVPDDASVSDALNDVSQAAQTLLSTTKSTLTGPDCSSSPEEGPSNRGPWPDRHAGSPADSGPECRASSPPRGGWPRLSTTQSSRV